MKQRLRLAAVSPALLEVYAADGMTLEQLMAFTVSEDHARQEQVWEAVRNSWQKEAWQIRRMLTETTVPASDRRARFVGVEAYEAAGGAVMRDLFQSDDGGWLQDVGLLDRLVTEKLKAAADAVAAEGWRWIEAAVSVPYNAAYGLRSLSGTPIDMTDEERAAREALREEQERLEESYDSVEELPEEVDARLGEIEAALEAFETRPMRYEAADMAMAGVFVSIDADGELLVDRGYVRPEDEVRAESEDDGGAATTDDGFDQTGAPVVRRAEITIGGRPSPRKRRTRRSGRCRTGSSAS
jgi:ParB family chromosome partitioning protein